MEVNQAGLSDNQRRFVCRVAFLLVCFLPTFMTVYQIFHQPTAADWQQKIQARLPIHVEIDSVETPLPSQVLLRGLRVIPSDSGTYPELDGFNASEVAIHFGFLQNHIQFLEPLTIESQAMASMLQRVFQQLESRSLDDNQWKVSFAKVTLRDSRFETRDFILKPLSLTLQRSSANQVADAPTIQARILARPNGNPDQQIGVELEKGHGGKQVWIDSKNGSLPANMLKHLVSDIPEMGANSVFCGQINLMFDSENRMNGWVNGDILNLRLDKLPDREKRLTGFCDVNGQINFEESRIVSGTMKVRSNDTISVDSSVFREAEEFGIEASVDIDENRVSVARLDMGLALQDGNVFFSGPKQKVQRRDGLLYEEEVVAFDSKGEPLVLCNSPLAKHQSIPLVSLAEILAGSGGNDSLEFLDKFKMPERTALQNDLDLR